MSSKQNNLTVALSGSTARTMDEDEIVEKVRQALARGTRKVNIISGQYYRKQSTIRQ